MAFRGKSAVITGGSNGIGLEVCKQLLAAEASNVGIIDIQENHEEICKLRAAHPSKTVLLIKMDVSKKTGIEATYEEILKSFGKIDIVVNVAGIFNDQDVHKTVTVNLPLINHEEICKLRAAHPSKTVLLIKMDVSKKTGIEATYEEILKSFGKIDIVVNVAGIFNDQDVHKTVTVNLGGIINSTLAAIHVMSKESGGNGGIIANMSSVVGLDPHFLMPVYSATKHGIVGFTRCLSDEYYFNRTGIKFVSLCPGATITQMFTNFTEKMIYPDMGDESYRVLNRLNKQSAADVSRCILTALDNPENGAVLIIENKKLFPINMMHYWRSIEDQF